MLKLENTCTTGRKYNLTMTHMTMSQPCHTYHMGVTSGGSCGKIYEKLVLLKKLASTTRGADTNILWRVYIGAGEGGGGGGFSARCLRNLPYGFCTVLALLSTCQGNYHYFFKFATGWSGWLATSFFVLINLWNAESETTIYLSTWAAKWER